VKSRPGIDHLPSTSRYMRIDTEQTRAMDGECDGIRNRSDLHKEICNHPVISCPHLRPSKEFRLGLSLCHCSGRQSEGLGSCLSLHLLLGIRSRSAQGADIIGSVPVGLSRETGSKGTPSIARVRSRNDRVFVALPARWPR
jgi:hypothetical protein